MKANMDERQVLLNDYAAASRALADAVERLRQIHNDVEAYIRALDETGTAHRACEQARIRFKRHTSGG